MWIECKLGHKTDTYYFVGIQRLIYRDDIMLLGWSYSNHPVFLYMRNLTSTNLTLYKDVAISTDDSNETKVYKLRLGGFIGQ